MFQHMSVDHPLDIGLLRHSDLPILETVDL